ncbi:hypothetical protein EDB89DRAFT_2069312 [Lactarius sanguifluus]|nr:hypothetical protein EDB89DRAFT_2069312 [Lactarius sanguifluus]
MVVTSAMRRILAVSSIPSSDMSCSKVRVSPFPHPPRTHGSSSFYPSSQERSFARPFNWNAKMHSLADFIDAVLRALLDLKRDVPKVRQNYSNLPESAIPAVQPTTPSPLQVQYGYRPKITPHLKPPPKKGNKISTTSEGWKPSWLKISSIQTGKRVVMDTEVAGIGLSPDAIGFAMHNAELDALAHEISFRSDERRADLQRTALVVRSPRKGCDAFVRRLPAPCADGRVHQGKPPVLILILDH